MSFIDDLKKILKQNIREYGMYIALFAIMVISRSPPMACLSRRAT